MAHILLTLAEDEPKTTSDHFAVRYSVDENDCYDFANGLKSLGHTVFFANWKDLSDHSFERVFCDNKKEFVDPIDLKQFDLAFIYKMEGFLFNLDRFYRMVSAFEDNCGVVVNHPKTIRHNIDKRYLWELQREGIAVPRTQVIDESVRQRLQSGEKIVLKPMRAERGYGAVLASRPQDLEQISGNEKDYLAQEYLPGIRDGERSLVFLGMEFQHAVLKKPAESNPQEFRCNESLGGTVQVYEPTREEITFATQVLSTYASLGYEVHFSRIDFVQSDQGPILIEAELLNPSMYANYSGKGKQFGDELARYFHKLIK